MMDASFLAELCAWAREGAAEFERLYRATGPTGITDDVALVAYRRCTALDTLLTARLDGERARLVATVGAAEARVRGADEEFGAADQAAGRLRERDHGPYPPTPAQRAHILSRRRETEGAADEARRELAVALRAVRAFDAATAGG